MHRWQFWRTLRSLRPLRIAALVWPVSVACTADRSEPGESAGAGSGGTGSQAGSGGGEAGGSCRAVGVGRIEVRITGLPSDVQGRVIVAGPAESVAVESDRGLDVSAGPYLLTPERVAGADPIVRSLFEPDLPQTELCLAAGETREVELRYVPVPTSHRLWTNNSNGDGNLLGFSGASLGATGHVEPSISVTAGAGKDVAFDEEGNLWSMGATVADPHLMRFPKEVFDSSGAKEPDRRIDILDVACLPALRSFAFDRGVLWVSTCGSGVVAVAPEQLETSGQVTPAVSIGGLTENGDLAFDIVRNLWVTTTGSVLRYDAERLETSIEVPDLTLTVRDAADVRSIEPSNLAFDLAGNLWIIDFGGNLVSKVAQADLEGAGERTAVAAVSLTLGVAALLERPAFDESGGLWLALDQDRFGRLSPAQLGASSGAGEPTVPETLIESPGMGNANRMAFFPASADLPLYHRFR